MKCLDGVLELFRGASNSRRASAQEGDSRSGTRRFSRNNNTEALAFWYQNCAIHRFDHCLRDWHLNGREECLQRKIVIRRAVEFLQKYSDCNDVALQMALSIVELYERDYYLDDLWSGRPLVRLRTAKRIPNCEQVRLALCPSFRYQILNNCDVLLLMFLQIII